MAWRFVYEDMAIHEATPADYRDLPVDGLQAVIVDGQPVIGLECCGLTASHLYLPRPKVREAELRKAHPDAHIVRGRMTSTRQMHKVEKLVGLWHPRNIEPFPGWMKDVIGWRLWTETEVFDSAGVAEADWLALWHSLPAIGIQGVKLYENWKSNETDDYYQYFAGMDFYYMAPSPFGPVFGNDPDADLIRARYPGAIVKQGTQMPDDDYRRLEAEILAAESFA